MKYNLAVSSKVPLADSNSLNQAAYLLGKQIATKGHTLLSPINLSLTNKVAAGSSDKAGLSIGFSPAKSFRRHVDDLQLPTDVYDWIYFSNLSGPALLTALIQNSQALFLIGGVMASISELTLAADYFLPVGVLLDEDNQSNNNLLAYLKSLPIEKQRSIVVHKDPQVLLNTVLKMIDADYEDINDKSLAKNNKLFYQLFDGITQQTKTE